MSTPPPELPPHTHRSIAGRNGKKIWYHVMRKAPPHTSIGPGGNTLKEARANAREFLRFHADHPTPSNPMNDTTTPEDRLAALKAKLAIIDSGQTAIMPSGEIVPRGTPGSRNYDPPKQPEPEHKADCDTNDHNPEGIRKPCNCKSAPEPADSPTLTDVVLQIRETIDTLTEIALKIQGAIDAMRKGTTATEQAEARRQLDDAVSELNKYTGGNQP